MILKKSLFVFILFSCQLVLTQERMESKFDFWIGNWSVRWDDGQGNAGSGINIIEKILDDKVILENFKVLDGDLKGFKGISISVFDIKNKVWKQTWNDNQGSSLEFIGETANDERIFKTNVVIDQGKAISSRMRFLNIKENSFTWDWESSDDGGKSWKLNWRIYYKRMVDN
jgi:hypothetical protein